MENSPLTNAGYGSNLTWDGHVECDASVMDGSTLHFGAVGAVPGVKNPVKLAQHICKKQRCNTLALGRTPPWSVPSYLQFSILEFISGRAVVPTGVIGMFFSPPSSCCDLPYCTTVTVS